MNKMMRVLGGGQVMTSTPWMEIPGGGGYGYFLELHIPFNNQPTSTLVAVTLTKCFDIAVNTKKIWIFPQCTGKCIDAHTYVSTLLNTSPFSCSPCGSQKLLDDIDLWAFFEIEPIILTLWCLRSILGFCWWRLFHIYSHKSTFWCSLPHVRHCIMSWAGCVKIEWNDPVYHNYVALFYISSYFYHMLRPP